MGSPGGQQRGGGRGPLGRTTRHMPSSLANARGTVCSSASTVGQFREDWAPSIDCETYAANRIRVHVHCDMVAVTRPTSRPALAGP
jgi:hypothetical protein